MRKGGTAGAQGDNTKPQDEVWVAFARSMAPLTMPAANFIAELIGAAEGKPCKVLDIAAGHGNYGITVAKKNPNAQIVAVDWPSVLAVAEENATKAGVSSRYTTRPGSAFEADLGSGYDFVLLTNIFHHFDQAACEKLMRRVHAALKPGGKAVTLEFMPNEDRVTPPAAAAFSLNMLVGTDAGDAYTFMLPGGYGTLDETFEILTWAQLGIHTKPIGLLNTAGYFDPLLAWIDRAVDDGFIRTEHRKMLNVATNPDELLDALHHHEPAPSIFKWIDAEDR